MLTFFRIASTFIALEAGLAQAQINDLIPIEAPKDVKVAWPTWTIGTSTWAFRCVKNAKGEGDAAYFGQVYDRGTKRTIASANIGGGPAGMTMARPLIWKDRLYKGYQKLDRKGGGLTVALQEVDTMTLADIGDLRTLGSLPYKSDDEAEFYNVPYLSNHDSSFLAIVVTGFKDDENQASILAMVVNDALEPVWSKVFSIPVKARRLQVSDVAVDGKGNVHVGYVEYEGPPALNAMTNRTASRLFQLNAQGAKEVPMRLPSGRSPENIALCSAPKGLAVAGYTTNGSGKRNEILSTFFGYVNADGTSVDVGLETAFEAPIGGWATQVDLLPKANGGYFLVGAVVPVPQAHAIHVQSISSSLSNDWQRIIPRKHGSTYGQNVFKAYARTNKLSVVFEETSKNIARMIAGEEISLVSDVSPTVICRADMGEDGKPTYFEYGKGVGNGALTTVSLNKAEPVGNGEQVLVIPVKAGDMAGPLQIGYFEFVHGEPVGPRK